MRGKLAVVAVLTVWIDFGAAPSMALADGGTVRFSEERSGRRITVFSTPTPLAVGPADISVLVQDLESGRPLLDGSIVVHSFGRSPREGNPPSGDHGNGHQQAHACGDARARRTWAMARGMFGGRFRRRGSRSASTSKSPKRHSLGRAGPVIAWPLVVIGFFVVHQVRASRRPASSVGRLGQLGALASRNFGTMISALGPAPATPRSG